jgi:hypothetical protein
MSFKATPGTNRLQLDVSRKHSVLVPEGVVVDQRIFLARAAKADAFAPRLVSGNATRHSNRVHRVVGHR